jgi:hypothetical protein
MAAERPGTLIVNEDIVTMNAQNMNTRIGMKHRWLYLVALGLTPLAAGCGLVDSSPDTATVTDVKPYYAKLETSQIQYHYTTSYALAGAAASHDTLEMEMYGRALYDYQNMPTYGCNWTFLKNGYAPHWYYCLSQDSAVDLGDTSFNEHWTDLKAPLSMGKTWSFARKSGEVVLAKVTQMGSSVKVNGREFHDVVAVEYTGDRGTSSVRWFAKDIGMIFGHTQDASGSVSEEKFVNMGVEK